MKRTLALALAAGFILHPSSWLSAQGPLTPPGAPAPTMKTLDQIEPRTPISQPGQAIGSGSYYLTANLIAARPTSGIMVIGSDVTIDLNGFELVGIAGSGTGIVIGVGQSNVTIRNGTIRNWGGKGIDGVGNARVRVENVRVMNNDGGGIIVDVNSEVVNCIADGNAGTGIKTIDNGLIENCQAISTTGSPGTGILTGDSCLIDRCISRSNAGIGVSSGKNCRLTNCGANNNGGDAGIHTSDSCILIGCTANFNSSTLATSAGIMTAGESFISQCTVIGSNNSANPFSISAGMGINVLEDCTVERCLVSICKGDGIRASQDCSITANTCEAGGPVSFASGIHTTGSGNRIESNLVNRNGHGIDVSAAGNLILKNSALGNDYRIAAGNRYGTIVNITAGGAAAVNGLSAASTLTSTDPWANFSTN